MKIAFITPGYLPMPPVEGGAVENLVDIFLQENEKTKKHDITIFSNYSRKAFIESKKYLYTKYKYIYTDDRPFKIKQVLNGTFNKLIRSRTGNAYIRQVVKEIKKTNQEFDAIIVENKPEFILYLKNTINSKYILHLHNDYLNEVNINNKMIINNYDLIFTVSDFLKNNIFKISTVTPVHTLNNGIDLNKFNGEVSNSQSKLIREKYNINDEFIFLYTGRLTESKGVDQIIKAFNQLPNNIKTKLLIVGSVGFGANKESKYISCLNKLSYERKKDIIFTGYIDYEQLGDIYAISDVGIVPTRVNEAFGLTVVEHLASGNPVIATKVGGIPEIVNDKSAILVENDSNLVRSLKNAMTDLVINPEKVNKMKSFSKKRARKFDSKLYYDRFVELLDLINYKD